VEVPELKGVKAMIFND